MPTSRKAKDANKDANDADNAAHTGGGTDSTRDATGAHNAGAQKKTTTDNNNNNEDGLAAKVKPAEDDGHDHVHHDDSGLSEFEIEIREGEDAKGLVKILREAGYDVEIAEMGEDGKYTTQNFDNDDYKEMEKSSEKGKKRKQRHDEGLPNHDEL